MLSVASLCEFSVHAYIYTPPRMGHRPVSPFGQAATRASQKRGTVLPAFNPAHRIPTWLLWGNINY